MNKKIFMSLLSIMMVAMFSVCFTSCGDDDDSTSMSGGNEEKDTHEYVDLGLPSGTLWATCNVGASKPEEYGDYFAWGETTGYKSGKTVFNITNYKWCNGSKSTYTKYCTRDVKGTVDGKTELEATDDAATANWGRNWQMPSKEQIKELVTSCTWTWTEQNGVSGYDVEGTNGNTIFLPAAGDRYNESLNHEGSGRYWSRTLNASDVTDAYNMKFSNDYVESEDAERSDGESVRPVRTKN